MIHKKNTFTHNATEVLGKIKKMPPEQQSLYESRKVYELIKEHR